MLPLGNPGDPYLRNPGVRERTFELTTAVIIAVSIPWAESLWDGYTSN